MLGPSGCGKTTTLRAIAGLERQTDGHIDLGDTRVDDLAPAERDIAMVFQFYALYPHLRTRDNIAFPLRAEGVPGDEVERRVARGRADAPARAPARPAAEPALGRRAAAGRARARARARATGVPDGRAAHESRRGDPRGHAHGDQAPPGAARHDDGLRHPRPARGDVARAADRDPQQRPARAGRDADGGLRAPGDAVLRTLHRLAADQPRARCARRRRAARGGRARPGAAAGARARPPGRGGRPARGARARRARTPARWPRGWCPRRRWATR